MFRRTIKLEEPVHHEGRVITRLKFRPLNNYDILSGQLKIGGAEDAICVLSMLTGEPGSAINKLTEADVKRALDKFVALTDRFCRKRRVA